MRLSALDCDIWQVDPKVTLFMLRYSGCVSRLVLLDQNTSEVGFCVAQVHHGLYVVGVVLVG